MLQPTKIFAKYKIAIKNRLAWLAVLFLGLYSLILTLSPAVKYRSWNVDLQWWHWIGFFLWGIGFFWFRQLIKTNLITKDPTLQSVFGLLIGWGILTIWQISPVFGLRQAVWFIVSVGLSSLFLKQPTILYTLKKYKYILLVTGLLLSALTFLFGTYPGGVGPRLWLGMKGIYFQPSELLKLLVIIYLSAYFSEINFPQIKIIQTIFPTLVLVLAALFILVAQRDLGTALIFIAIYVFMLFIAYGKKRILAIGLGLVALSALVGYNAIDLIRIRFQGWLMPWADTQAGSYQITQSLIAIATGGVGGTGVGLGNPRLIPISHSDFIFSAIVEETGLAGAIALILFFALILFRGFSIAVKTSDRYYRYLAAGISIYITSQAILILGGNIRLLPITGVTLPFLSYGGSSLLISFLSACILIFIDSQTGKGQEPGKTFKPFQMLGILFSVSLLLISIVTGWWAVIRANDLQLRNDNPRHFINERFVKRGAILDRDGLLIAHSTGDVGSFKRLSKYPPLSNTIGFSDIAYGSMGLEESLDDYLSGERGYPAFDLWFNNLLYDQPLPGRDIRLTIDLELQTKIDELMQSKIGSAIVINAKNGEILAIASHPSINSNNLAASWESWKADPDSPFINRAVQGAYPVSGLITPFLLPKLIIADIPEAGLAINYYSSTTPVLCAIKLSDPAPLKQEIVNGCPSAFLQINALAGLDNLHETIKKFHLTQTPDIGLPVNQEVEVLPGQTWGDLFFGKNPLRANPLQMAVSFSAITHHGLSPIPQILSSVNTSEKGWVIVSDTETERLIAESQADLINDYLSSAVISGWEVTAQGYDQSNMITWFAAGTPSNWAGTPVTIVMVLENEDPDKTQSIGRAIYNSATN